jgi:hypothetical protein
MVTTSLEAAEFVRAFDDVDNGDRYRRYRELPFFS